MLALLNLESEINAIYPTFGKEPGFPIRLTDIRVQKINGTILDTYEIVVAAFLVTDKINQVRFFEKTFLVANISPKIVLRMFFFTLSGADVDFLDQEFRWRTYTTKRAFSTTRHIKLVSKIKFAAAALDSKNKMFVVQIASLSSVASLNSSPFDVYLFCKPQIVGLIAKKTLTKIPNKYVNFADVFFPDLASKLLKHTRINSYTI